MVLIHSRQRKGSKRDERENCPRDTGIEGIYLMKIRVKVRRHPEGGVLTDQTHADLSRQQPGPRSQGVYCPRQRRETMVSVTCSLFPCTK